MTERFQIAVAQKYVENLLQASKNEIVLVDLYIFSVQTM